MECQYCKKVFLNQYTLKNHQVTTKKCIIIQKGIPVGPKIFQCGFCNKILSSKIRLDQHYSSCKTKQKKDLNQNEELNEVSMILRNEKQELEFRFQKTIEEKDLLIKELQEKLEKEKLEKEKRINITNNKNIKKNITNNITNNILTIYEVMKPEHVEDFFKKHYNLDTLLQGVPGLAKFICDGFIREKASYICTDRSRHKFMMKDDHGNTMEDTNCEQLVSLTAPGMNHVKDVYENGLFERDTPEEIHSHYQPISALDKDTTPLRSELSKIVPSESTTKPMNDDWKKHFVAMRESYEKNKPKVNEEVIHESEPVIQEILGYSLGYLKKYKEGYQKRREIAGCEVEIKGPKPLMELYQTDPMIREKYDLFIKS